MDIIFNSNKVRFNKLDELISSSNIGENFHKGVNVFINLEPILFKLTVPSVVDELRMEDIERNVRLISHIINLASHYKLFFIKQQIDVKVFLYLQHPFSSKPQKNKKINPDYRDMYSYKFSSNTSLIPLRDTINNAIPFIQLILEYIQGVHLVRSSNIENSLIPSILSNDDRVNFIVSDNMYDFQYVNKNFNIIIPRQDKSQLLTKQNIMNYIQEKFQINNMHNIDSTILPFVNSIMGSELRNIYNIKGIGMKTIFKLLNKAIDLNLITNSTNNSKLLIAHIIADKHKDLVLTNFYCTDIDTQLQMLSVKDIYEIESQIKDKFDNLSLRDINDKYFSDHPLNLIELTSSVSGTKKPQILF